MGILRGKRAAGCWGKQHQEESNKSKLIYILGHHF
jgi:hypothetical protein